MKNLPYYKVLDFRMPHNFSEIRLDDLVESLFTGELGANDLVCLRTSENYCMIRNNIPFTKDLLTLDRHFFEKTIPENWKILLEDIWIHKRLFFGQPDSANAEKLEKEKKTLLKSVAKQLKPHLFHDEELFTLFYAKREAPRKSYLFWKPQIPVLVAVTDLRIFHMELENGSNQSATFIWDDCEALSFKKGKNDQFQLNVGYKDSTQVWSHINAIDYSHLKKLLPGLIATGSAKEP